MANAIPYQLGPNGSLLSGRDQTIKRAEMQDVISEYLGESVRFFDYYKNQHLVTGVYKNNGREVYFMIANITFMGGTEGQHPKDLKRIQYNYRWYDFYKEYKEKGEVKWLGLYSYNDIKIFAEFKPETYIKKHEKGLYTKKGKPSNYSCHVFLNDLYQGNINGFFKKIDKNGNTINTISIWHLKEYFDGSVSESPIITKIKEINRMVVPWNRWVQADEAISFMYNLNEKYNDRPCFRQWKQNLWNGWYVEALYSEELIASPSEQITYLSTEKDKKLRIKYNTGLDLAFPVQNFVGDLKAMSNAGSGESLLNDETRVNDALSKYKRIWFVIYLHDTKQGKTNDYEMVKWRNHFIADKEGRECENELSAPGTQHSVMYTNMIVIELNEITRDRYFNIGRQFGLNSDGHERNNKYKIKKKLLKELVNDDGFVIYRESHSI